VLKLIYHAAAFGPIDLEYDRPVVRVGRSEDNDLVLRHRSVESHHCVLVFRGEKVLCLSPSQAIASQSDLASLTGRELGPGDSLRIGELQFSLAHSPKTVALPGVHSQAPLTGASVIDPAIGIGQDAAQERYYCAHCRVFFRDAELKRVGLVGRAKRKLCPKCSLLLETEPELPKPAPDPKKRALLSWCPGARVR
jgi:hypothetical protein